MRNKSLHEKEIQDLELRLQEALRPVSARPEFVHELHHKLSQDMNSSLKDREENSWQVTVITMASLLSGVFLLVLGVRAIIVLLNNLRASNPLKKQIEKEPSTPLGQAV